MLVCNYSIYLLIFLFFINSYLYFRLYVEAWSAIWYNIYLNWFTHLFILYSCCDIISKHSKSCFTTDFVDFGFSKTSLSFYDMRISVAFFLVDELCTFYSNADAILADRLFLGVDNPEIINFFFPFSLSCRLEKLIGFWKVYWF